MSAGQNRNSNPSTYKPAIGAGLGGLLLFGLVMLFVHNIEQQPIEPSVNLGDEMVYGTSGPRVFPFAKSIEHLVAYYAKEAGYQFGDHNAIQCHQIKNQCRVEILSVYTVSYDGNRFKCARVRLSDQDYDRTKTHFNQSSPYVESLWQEGWVEEYKLWDGKDQVDFVKYVDNYRGTTIFGIMWDLAGRNRNIDFDRLNVIDNW